jgi:hypothetical protein
LAHWQFTVLPGRLDEFDLDGTAEIEWQRD